MPIVLLHQSLMELFWIKLKSCKEKYTLYQPLPIRGYPVFSFKLNGKFVSPYEFILKTLFKPVQLRWKRERRRNLPKSLQQINKKARKWFMWRTTVHLTYPANGEPVGWFLICKTKEKIEGDIRKWTTIAWSDSEPNEFAVGVNTSPEMTKFYRVHLLISPGPNTISVIYYNKQGAKLLSKFVIPPLPR